MKNHIKELFKEAISSSLIIFKIMIPVSIIIKILKETGVIEVLGRLLAPIMTITGLPGDAGIVWFTGMATNLYGGILAYSAISSNLNLTVAQVTILTTMMLVAHSFPVELMVAGKSGAKIRVIFLVRFLGGIAIGIKLFVIYSIFGVLEQPAIKNWAAAGRKEETLFQWVFSEIRYYLFVFIIIFSLMALMKILKKIGIITFMNRFFSPFFNLLGIGREVIPLTIIGMTVGVAYGGALIINEAKKGNIGKKDLFYSMVFLSLCHSIIEDTLLMLSLGGHYTGILIIRPLFAFGATFIMVRIFNSWTEDKFLRLLTR